MLVFGVLSRSGRRRFSLSALYLLLRIAICHLDQLLLVVVVPCIHGHAPGRGAGRKRDVRNVNIRCRQPQV